MGPSRHGRLSVFFVRAARGGRRVVRLKKGRDRKRGTSVGIAVSETTGGLAPGGAVSLSVLSGAGPRRGGRTPGKVSRVISTARLRASQPAHLRPIDVVVYDDPWGRSYLGGGFALRCFQRLSWPGAATRRCGWRHNRFTGGRSDTVLSY